jgi:hypothetical protein
MADFEQTIVRLDARLCSVLPIMSGVFNDLASERQGRPDADFAPQYMNRRSISNGQRFNIVKLLAGSDRRARTRHPDVSFYAYMTIS